MNKELLISIIKNKDNVEDHTQYFQAVLSEINKLIVSQDNDNFLNNSKEMEVWEKISNAQISENPKATYPKEMFVQDLIELIKN